MNIIKVKIMRTFLITTLSKNKDGSQLANLMDYHFENMPTIKQIIDEFTKAHPNNKDVSIISIMEFNEADYKQLLSEQ